MIRSLPDCGAVVMSFHSGESGSLSSASPAWRTGLGAADRRLFPPQVRAEVIRLACELPAGSEVPLARWSSSELAAEVVARGICEQISGVTVWRWLSEDAIKPWQYRSWIFPRDPEFAAKAGRILDLYAGRWEGELLHPGDYVVCCDEKPSIQARRRKHATLPAAPAVKRGQRVEHEYERGGALCYLAAWDARRAKLFDRCAAKDGIVPFDALVDQFMSTEPYNKARRVFVIVDNGSAHRGKASINRLQRRYKNLILIHTPVHASWLNQCEIYFSIVQRKALTPNNFTDLNELEQQLLAFGRRYEQIAAPFQWKFTRADLDRVIHKLDRPAAQALTHRYVGELPSQSTKRVAPRRARPRGNALLGATVAESRRQPGRQRPPARDHRGRTLALVTGG